MNWHRIKTVLIFLFLAINLFLTSLLLYENIASKKAEEKRLHAAIAVLRAADIRMETGKVIADGARMATLTVENPTADAEAFATSLLGDTPLRMGNTYRRQGKTVTITETGFCYHGNLAPKGTEKDAVGTMRDALRKMGFSMNYAKGYEKDGKVYFTTLVSGRPLYDCTLMVTPSGTEIASIEGKWPHVLEVQGTKERVSGAADALIRLLNEPNAANSTVTEVSLGYAVLVDGGYQTANAVPVWRIVTDKAVYMYDARI